MVSVIVPAYAAQATVGRAVRSVVDQTWRDWEAIVVSDDGVDYDAHLRGAAIRDSRLRFVSTGKIRSGCHNARNVGLAAANGDVVAALDADDLFYPERLAALVPLALDHGAAVDNPAVVSDETGAVLYRAFGDARAPVRLGIGALLDVSTPLFPLVRRDHAEPRLAGIEHGEDFVANLRLIDRLGSLLAIPPTLCEYRVVTGSMCHADNSAGIFDAVYAALIERVTNGDGLGLSHVARPVAAQGLARKRALNQAFAAARRDDPNLNFQSFVAGRKTPGPRG